MNALYRNRIYRVVDVAGDITLEGSGGGPFDVSLCDPVLIVDPTDYEVANAANLAEWHGISEKGAKRLRLMLLGALSLAEWQSSSEQVKNH